MVSLVSCVAKHCRTGL